MFCNYCGSQVAAEQSVCSHCGGRTTGVLAASAARKRVAEHIHLLAILWFVLGVFFVVPAVIMGVLASVVVVPLVSQSTDKMAIVLAPVVFVTLCVVFLVSAALHFTAGWGLLKMRPWGRTFALVIAFLALVSPPFDTALGIYTLFVLLPDAAGDEYRQMLQTATPRTSAQAVGIAG
jgi:ABC-type spermidine/putrescine transport system permease subunit II